MQERLVSTKAGCFRTFAALECSHHLDLDLDLDLELDLDLDRNCGRRSCETTTAAARSKRKTNAIQIQNANTNTITRWTKRPRSRTERRGSCFQSHLFPGCVVVLLLLSCTSERFAVNGYSHSRSHSHSNDIYSTNHRYRVSPPFGERRRATHHHHNSITQRKGWTTRTAATTRLHESSQPFDAYDDGFPSMMDELSNLSGGGGGGGTGGFGQRNGTNTNGNTNTAASRNVISNGPGFVPTNGISEKINGYEYRENYLQSLELDRSLKERLEREETERLSQQTAPEVNNWTSIMKWGLFFQKKKKVETVDEVYEDLRDMSPYDCEQVDIYWDRLLPVVSYLGTERCAKIYDALRVAYRAHRGQARKSGEPFIIHPVEVALLLAGLKMDEDTVMAGLLHDTVEDTDLTFELVEEMFGKTVRGIVEGETKVSKLPKLAIPDYADEQAENLRQMFVAMTDDYRIIIVKLADRLHNMRTLQHMKPEKQIKISRETLDIFAPLAHRMGIWQFKSELEDTAFMYLYPLEYKRLSRKLDQRHAKYEDTLEKSQKILKDRLNSDPTLRQQAADVKVSGRMKEIYSLWHKMETKGERNLDHIVDVVALRVIITPKANPEDDENVSDRAVWLCYHVLGLVQHLDGFQPFPTRVKDYISFPKPNGYQSLHTALILNGQKIEVQIRTNLMHQVAEYGMASHWAYTDGKRRQDGSDDLYNTPWLSSIKEWQDEKLNARDFVDSVRNELLGKRVFVFLRNGQILNLARGSTAIDAAFQIHTEVGLNMHGVEINGKPVSISYELQNGDVVSILTGEGRPSTDWIRYAKSRSARSKLRSYFREKQKESLCEAGKILLMDYLWMHGPLIEKSSYLEEEFSIPTTVQEVAALLPGNTRFDDIDDLLIKIGKQEDRAMLHSFVSKLFKVPQKPLINAEKNRESLIPKSVLDAVRERQKKAQDAAAAVASAQSSATFQPMPGTQTETEDPPSAWPKPKNGTSFDRAVRTNGDDDSIRYADPEHLCTECLPVYGDDIIGTVPVDSTSEATPTVHRICCSIAQRAINEEVAGSQRPTDDYSPSGGGGEASFAKQRVDSISLRQGIYGRFQDADVVEKPVPLRWSASDAGTAHGDEPEHVYPCEIVVHCQDRKLLLADCSETVSELSEIIKTGSLTTNEHATLVFLIKIRCLDDLQRVMNSLRQIPSVMAVERRVRFFWTALPQFDGAFERHGVHSFVPLFVPLFCFLVPLFAHGFQSFLVSRFLVAVWFGINATAVLMDELDCNF